MAANDLLKDKKILQYPTGLGSNTVDSRGNESQYMLFKINTDEKSTPLRSDAKSGRVMVTDNRTGIGVQTSNFTAANAKEADPDARLKFGSEEVDKTKWRVQKGMVRLDKVIVLPMPNEHTVGTSIKYNDAYDSNMLTKAGDLYNQLGTELAWDIANLGKNAGVSGIVNVLKGKPLTLENIKKELRDPLAEDRYALNPKKEVMFDSFGYRTFSFRYQFAPKSLAESQTVSEIIETFRYYALPEITKSRLFYIFPAEFELSFMLGMKDNPNIPRITTSVLQRVSVNYSPNAGIWATLPNGAPIAIDMTLDFLELEMVDRSRVYNKDSAVTSGY
jgi:hypothetical protein